MRSGSRTLAEFPHLLSELDHQRNGGLDPLQLSAGSGRKLWWKCDKGKDHRWQTTVIHRTRNRSGCPFCSGKKASRASSLASLFPKVARQWHPTLNGELRPQDITFGSSRMVWWKCDKGPDHVWQAPPANRTRLASGCPFCRGIRASVTNSLAARFPAVAAEWHPTRNRKLTPHDVPAGHAGRVWWQCPKGPDHVWQATVRHRTASNSGCPFCAGQQTAKADSLARKAPQLAKTWHPTRNGSLTPSQVTPRSGRLVWWKCPKGSDHEWQTPVYARLGCPFCAGVRVSKDTSLARCKPSLAGEWHPTRNGSLTPKDVTTHSTQKVWWKCRRDAKHVWRTSVASRAVRGSRCPVCSGRVALRDTSIVVLAPAVARQFHPTKNGSLRPERLRPGSFKRVWWKCPKGPDHEWHARVFNRVRDAAGCPFCRKSNNTLLLRRPDLAAEWHPWRNKKLLPRDVAVTSRRRVWWLCPVFHEWDGLIYERQRGGASCPYCRNRKRAASRRVSGPGAQRSAARLSN